MFCFLLIDLHTSSHNTSDNLQKSHSQATPHCQDTTLQSSLYLPQTVKTVPIQVLSEALLSQWHNEHHDQDGLLRM